MVVIKTMVGEMEIGETNWGDEDKYAELCRSKPPDQSNIRVVVKIRPPNQRELALPGGVVVNALDDGKTVVLDGKPPFVYDVAFPFSTSQLGVFEIVGVPIVQTAYNGFNASMFAYGQTSSGKSFSMMGVRGTELVGLIPRIAHLLFHVVTTTPNHEFYIEGSYLEIYNEKLKDLMSKSGEELKVRENPELGVHVAGLTKILVKTSDDCEKLIEDGTSSRTVAATKYNSESSRSHAVFELHIQHKYKDDKSGEEMQARTKIALIDLAGSERSDKLGSVGKALQEGNNINKSLTVLGRCIKALVEQANNPKKKIQVPFRESVLTYYLRESLAGNARTTMLAACSPAGSNEEETTSTLRYAASAKQIKTAAKKSEDPLKAKARELNEEVEKLKAMLAGKGGGGGAKRKPRKSVIGQASTSELESLSEEDKEAYLKQLEEQMEMMGMGGYARAAAKFDDAAPKKKKGADLDPRDVFPQLSCLNKDDLLSHAMVIPLKFGKLSIGRSDAPTPNDFEIDGMGMCERHCLVQGATETSAAPTAASGEGGEGGEGGEAAAAASSGALTTVGASVTLLDDMADLHVNGQPLQGVNATQPLKHLDRVIIGPCRIVCLYLTQKLTGLEKAQHTYDAAFREFMSGDDNAARLLMSPRRQALLDEVQSIEGLMLKEANIIAYDLCTNIEFVSQLLLGADGLSSSSATLDDLIQRNECRVKVVCHASAKRIGTSADLQEARRLKKEANRAIQAAKSKKHLLRTQSAANAAAGASSTDLLKDESLGATPVKEGEGNDLDDEEAAETKAPLKVLAENILFEMEADSFSDLLSELKATHHGLSQLLGGVQSAGKGLESGTASMIRSVFDAVDTDRSGAIDKYELQACIEKFNVNSDPEFFKHVLREEGIKEDDELDFDRFEGFLLRFLQHQFYKKIEAYVSNKHLFMMLGGRSVKLSHRGTILEVKSRASVFGGMASVNSDAAGAKYGEDGKEQRNSGDLEGGGSGDGQIGEGDDDDDEDPDVKARREEAEAQAARAKKMGREAKQARIRQRMRQNAVVTNFITTLKGDLQKAMNDLDSLTEPANGGAAGGGKDDGAAAADGGSGGGKSSAKDKGGGPVAPLGKLTGALRVGGRRNKKSDKDVYGAMADKVKKAIKDLEQQHKQTMHVSKERDKLEEYLTNMLAARDACIPDGNDQDHDGGGNGGGGGGPGGGGGMGGLPGLGGGGGGGDTGSMMGFIDSIGGKPGRALDL